MSRPPLIGLAGKARSGKDTVASFLLAAIGGYAYSFADPIRNMLKQLNIDMSDPYWRDRKEEVIPMIGVSPRRMMQTLGTEWGREMINPDLWLLMAHQRLLQHGAGMIVTDVRFENEAAWIRSNRGLIIHVNRPDVSGVEEHVSEAGIAVTPRDVQLFNNGTLDELQFAVRELASVYQT